MSNTPSDAELDELIFDVYPTYQAPEALDRIQIREAMKKAVAKWGTPQPVVREPLTDAQWQRITDLTGGRILTQAVKDEIERVIGIKGGQHG